MNVYVFKTNINSLPLVEFVKPYFDSNSNILKWSVDIEDIDNVLRVESNGLLERDVINIVEKRELICKLL
jgi:hypothetical protein